MVIENRNSLAGTRLVANYKKQAYVCTVEAGENGEGVVFVLEDGSRHKSASAAGSKVMGGKAVNGWRFWSLDGDAPSATEAESKPAPKKGRARKLIYRVPNQQGTPEGKAKFFCAACMKAFRRRGRAAQRLPRGPQDRRPGADGAGSPERGS